MIKEGALDNPRPETIFALHISPELECGKVGYRAGAAQASLDGFDITVLGQAAFAATPERGVDAIAVAGECITALGAIRGRRVSAFEPVVLNIGTIHVGTRRFGVATEVRMEGCLRTLNEDLRQRAKALMHETLKGVTEANDAKFVLSFSDVTSVLYNDPALVAGALPVVRRAVGTTNVVEVPKRLGGEDFSYYGKSVPGFLFRLGCGNERRGITAQIHTPEFDLDENCLVVGVRTMAAVLTDYLQRHGQQEH
jgi:amidohydrolase